MRSDFSTRAPVMKTSLNSELPVICFSGRTSTPGWRMRRRRHAVPGGGATGGQGRGVAPGSRDAGRPPREPRAPPPQEAPACPEPRAVGLKRPARVLVPDAEARQIRAVIRLQIEL